MRVFLKLKALSLFSFFLFSLTACGTKAENESQPPFIASITPSMGSNGTLVMIKGNTFSNNSQVSIGGVSCPTIQADLNQIFCTVGTIFSHSAVDVVVTNGDSQSSTLKNGFTSNIFAKISTPHSNGLGLSSSPEIQRISPNHGPIQGGTRVLIKGSSLSSVIMVTIGGRPCTSIQYSFPDLTCTTPDGDAGPASVVVANSESSVTVEIGYFYLN